MGFYELRSNFIQALLPAREDTCEDWLTRLALLSGLRHPNALGKIRSLHTIHTISLVSDMPLVFCVHNVARGTGQTPAAAICQTNLAFSYSLFLIALFLCSRVMQVFFVFGLISSEVLRGIVPKSLTGPPCFPRGAGNGMRGCLGVGL